MVGGGVLRFHQRAERAGRAVGGQPHPAEGESAGEVALAGGGEPFHGDWLPAGAVFTRHLDVGDSADCGQDDGALVRRGESGAGAYVARAGREGWA